MTRKFETVLFCHENHNKASDCVPFLLPADGFKEIEKQKDRTCVIVCFLNLFSSYKAN